MYNFFFFYRMSNQRKIFIDSAVFNFVSSSQSFLNVEPSFLLITSAASFCYAASDGRSLSPKHSIALMNYVAFWHSQRAFNSFGFEATRGTRLDGSVILFAHRIGCSIFVLPCSVAARFGPLLLLLSI